MAQEASPSRPGLCHSCQWQLPQPWAALTAPGASGTTPQVTDSATLRAALPCSLPPDQRVARLDAAARGVLAETALRGRQRYEWRLLLPLLHALVDVLLAEYTPPEEEVRCWCNGVAWAHLHCCRSSPAYS